MAGRRSDWLAPPSSCPELSPLSAGLCTAPPGVWSPLLTSAYDAPTATTPEPVFTGPLKNLLESVKNLTLQIAKPSFRIIEPQLPWM